MSTKELNDSIIVNLTTHQLLELSQAFNKIREEVSGSDLRSQLFLMAAKLWAHADKRRRANEIQAHAFELSVRRARSLKSSGVVS